MPSASGERHYNFKHGLRKTKEFGIWWQMIQRCRNPSHKAYPNYGGRGISVCDRWKSFANFHADMGQMPEGKSLDRVDVNGNYEPANCRWATPSTQAANRRVTRIIEWDGERLPITAWDTKLGYSKGTIAERLKSGWRLEDAMLPKDYLYGPQNTSG